MLLFFLSTTYLVITNSSRFAHFCFILARLLECQR